jgi:RNA polymerase sigma factor (sigma-70 family)
VAWLEETDRKLFVGRYFHSYSPRELSEVYGMKENALNQRLYRIRERLRKHLAERGYTV